MDKMMEKAEPAGGGGAERRYCKGQTKQVDMTSDVTSNFSVGGARRCIAIKAPWRSEAFVSWPFKAKRQNTAVYCLPP